MRASLELDRRAGGGGVAVGFLHSFANAAHERRAATIAGARCRGLAGDALREVSPEMREYERISTACANAYVQPLIAGYLGGLSKALTARGFRCPSTLMTSGGGLTTIETADLPVRLVEMRPRGRALSWPATSPPNAGRRRCSPSTWAAPPQRSA